jgi:glyoxylase-like metal-dependent hydrolase (beta-lactamase superfamily II)
MQVTPNVRAVQVPDSNPMHPTYTTIYLVGHGQVFTIDSGEDFERYRWMLRGYLAAVEKAEIMLSGLSHHHADHSANLRWLQDEFGAEIHILEDSEPLLGPRLPEKGIEHIDEGDEIEVSGGVRLQVLRTPGHSVDSLCYYLEDEGVLFTGDTILGGSTTTIIDLSEYMASLERLRNLPNLKKLLPGHGPIMDNPTEVLDDYVRRRNVREQEIIEIMAQRPEVTSWDIVEACYQGVDRRLWRAADRVVQTHLHKLEKDGLIKVYPGTPKRADPNEVSKLAEEEHERLEILRQADDIRDQMKRRMVQLQEAGPAAEWDQQPRYELIRR